MKSSVLLLAIVISCIGELTEGYGDLMTHFANIRAMSLKMAKENCYPNSAEDFERFTEMYDNATACIQNVPKESPIFVSSLKTFKDSMQSCVDDIIEEQEHCYPDELKDWPQMSFDMFHSFIDFIYRNKEELSTPIVRNYIYNCSNEFSHLNQSQAEWVSCFQNLSLNITDIRSSCQELIEFGRCMVKYLVEKCPTDEDSVKKLTVDLLNAISEPCSEYHTTENPEDNGFTLLAPYAPPNINPDLM